MSVASTRPRRGTQSARIAASHLGGPVVAQAQHSGPGRQSAAQGEDVLAAQLAQRRMGSGRRHDLLVLGELNVDIIVDCGQVLPRFGQVDQHVRHVGMVLGSSGAITAVAAARLGLRTAVTGVVADDEFGTFVLRELDRAGVDTSGCLVRAAGSTGATVALVRDGDRAMLTSTGLIGDLAVGDVGTELLGSASHVHVSSFYLQHRLRDGLETLLAEARRRRVVTSMDPGWDPAEEWHQGLDAILPQIDYFLPNQAEACKISGQNRAAAAAASLARLGPTVVVKRGRQGVLVHSGNRSWSLPTRPVAALDSTGAGDNFNAGFVAGLAAGLDLQTACALGSACGALSTQGYGGTSSAAGTRTAWDLAMTIRHSPAWGVAPGAAHGQ